MEKAPTLKELLNNRKVSTTNDKDLYGIYHIQDDKIYEMSLNEPVKKIGVVASDETIMNIIDTVTEYMYCNWGDCCMKEKITWAELQKVRNEIKENAMEMIKANLDMKL